MKKHSNFNKKNKNKTHIVVICVSAFFALTILGVILFLTIFSDFFSYQSHLNLNYYSPNLLMQQAILDEGFSQDEMINQTIDLLVKKTDSDPFILSRYVLPGQLQSMVPVQSNQLKARDQIQLARIYIAHGDTRSARRLLDAIDETFSDENGRIIGYVLMDFELDHLDEQWLRDRQVLSSACLESTVAYLRAMLEYYDRWGTESDWARIEGLADTIFDGTRFYNDISFSPSKMSELIVGLDDYEDYFEDINSEEVYTAFRLSSLDLYAFKILANIDSTTYQPMYDAAVDIVINGMLTEDLPLFAFAYSESGGGYVYFMGEEAHVNLVSSLNVMLHLAEIDQLPASSLAWLKQQVYNVGYLYTHYDLLWGTPVTGEHSIRAYGLTMCIAVVQEDDALYARTLRTLSQNRATLSTSPARHMVFRQITTQRNMVVAEDNLLVILAMGS